MSSAGSSYPPPENIPTEDDEEDSDSPGVDYKEIVLSRTPPPPMRRTVDDEDIPDSEISPYGFDIKTKYFTYAKRIFRNPNLPENEEEHERQLMRFEYLFFRSDGFEINWDEFDFLFVSSSVAWYSSRIDEDMTNEELIEYLTRYAIDEHNKESEHPTNVVYVGPVMANFLCAAGYVFFITFRARDLLSPDPEPKLYQTDPRMLGGNIYITIFRQRPNYEGMILFAFFPSYELEVYQCVLLKWKKLQMQASFSSDSFESDKNQIYVA